VRDDATTNIGIVLFPGLTQLDLTGPFEVLSRIPAVTVDLVASTGLAVRSDTGLALIPTTTFASCPDLDVICVPGGPGVNEAMLNPELVEFVRHQAARARFITSVCSGALILGAAGLLKGRRATTHWASIGFLASFGAIPTDARVCIDGNLVTGGGVTAGIDFGLYLAGLLANKETAERIQLYLEYAPDPPFAAGLPTTAPRAVLDAYREAAAPMLERRAVAVRMAATSARRSPSPERCRSLRSDGCAG
jgi:cyclohexyl-isocyanide hydratase